MNRGILSCIFAFGMIVVAPAMAAATPEFAPAASPLAREILAREEVPLRIEITSDLQFNRLARVDVAGGEAQIDPGTGAASMRGGLINLGGAGMRGEALITGTPFRQVRVSLPASIRLYAAGGKQGGALLSPVQTDLPALPMLDANGELRFSFGGILQVEDGAAGNYRGRIAISVDYD